MHTAKSLQNMSDEAACKTARNLARQMFGYDRFKAALAEQVGVTRQTVNNWFDKRPPTLIILYLQAELGRREAQAKLDQMRSGFVGLLNKP